MEIGDEFTGDLAVDLANTLRAGRGFGGWLVASRPRQTWCSPACGNRAWLARFHQRHRAA